MNAKMILQAEAILKLLAFEKIKLEEIPKKLNMSEDDVRQILKYLEDKGSVKYIHTAGQGLSGVVGLEVTSKGSEVALNKRPLIDTPVSNFQQMNIHAPAQNIAQMQGSHNTVTQTVDNSSHNILKQMIESDPELSAENKTSLLDILGKFNKIKETGENAFDLIKKVSSIAVKYTPYFFALLK